MDYWDRRSSPVSSVNFSRQTASIWAWIGEASWLRDAIAWF